MDDLTKMTTKGLQEREDSAQQIKRYLMIRDDGHTNISVNWLCAHAPVFQCDAHSNQYKRLHGLHSIVSSRIVCT